MSEFTSTELRILQETRRCMPDIVAGVDVKFYPYGWALPETLPAVRAVFESITMTMVARAVETATGSSLNTLRCKAQRKPLPTHRALACLLLIRHCPERTASDLGRFLHKDRSSVVVARSRAEKLLAKGDPDFTEMYRIACRELVVAP